MLSWKQLNTAWMNAVNERNPGELLPLLAEDFCWPTSLHAADQGQVEGLKYEDMQNWVMTAKISDCKYESTIHDGEDVLVGTHLVTRKGVPSRVLAIAKIRNGKCYSYHHMLTPV